MNYRVTPGLLILLVTLILISSFTVINIGVYATGGIPKTDLVAQWKFQNNVIDSSRNTNDGTIVGRPIFVDGIIGKALCFNGIDDAVSVPNDQSLNFGSNSNFSISLWLKSKQSGGGDLGLGWLIDHRRNNDGVYAGYSIDDDSGIIIARIRDSAANDVAVYSNTNVNDGKSHHVVFVVDRLSGKEKLYIDNALHDSADISSIGNIDTGFRLNIGGTASPNTEINFFHGTLDQIRIYRQSLTESQIDRLFGESHNRLTDNNCS